ncbi:AT-rich interactive domain-containing protein 5B-like [Hypomesus transpacificus]|uniref:AT-rich interactive domain-containing protein 5B-like n=1 Tax=Hypomesus transpacificus TaxID=137520 RepID=UPI001F071307|nr:AT-rich interactive domain-containing protein 5B-like [Hypomesus transpacificus]
MERNSLKWVGSSCGLHGPYIFYKAFKFHRNGKPRILSLGDFFFVRCKPEDPICIAELQLLWEERTTKQLLSSSKLYFLPENTPLGRTVKHGEHEVIAVSEKVIVRLEDLVKWTVPDFSGWAHGLQAEPLKPAVLRELGTNGRREALHRYRESTLTSGLNFRDIQRERAQIGQEDDGRKVLVLSYPQYCRYRSVLARLREQPSALQTDHTVLALGGIASLHGNTHILYCRDTFEHPTLLQNESVCDEFAPNLKGRPRKKKLSVSQRRDSQGQTQGSQGSLGSQNSSSPEKSPTKIKVNCKVSIPNIKITVAKPKNNSICKKAPVEEKVKERMKEEKEEEEKEEKDEKREEESSKESDAEEQAFLEALYEYMKDRDSPIERIPFLGFKQINLWTMFQAARRLGGYELITVRRQWKNVYDELGGNPGSTSAATCTRRHYERLLLPYERHTKGEKDKPLPSAKSKKPEVAGGGVEGAGKPKAVAGVKRTKSGANQRQMAKRDKDETITVTEQTQVDEVKEKTPDPAVANQEVSTRDEPEEEELQLTFKKEEPLNEVKSPVILLPDSDCSTPQPASLIRDPCLLPEWQPPMASDQKTDKPSPNHRDEAERLPSRNPKYSPSWDHSKPVGFSCPPEPGRLDPPVTKEPVEIHGGRVGKVLPMCKQPPAPPKQQHSTDPMADKKDSACKKESSQGQFTAPVYSKVNLGVMSPLAKKKLLSQVCETNPYSFSGPPPPLPPPPCAPPLLAPPPMISDVCDRVVEAVGPRQGSSPDIPEIAPVFRPSVIQHAQSIKPHLPQERSPLGDLSESYSSRVSHLQTRINPPWHPYLHRPEPQDGVENAGEKLMQVPPQAPSYRSDCYSSPHLHSLYRQTENCLNQERMCGYPGGDKRGHFIRDCENGEGFHSSSTDRESLAYRAPLYHERTHTHGDRALEDEPRDFSISKPISQRLSFSKPSFCGLPYPIMHQGLDSHPKACRVPPMTISAPKHCSQDASQSYPSCKPSSESLPTRVPCKRSLGELENEGLPDRKIRVVTPMHPAGSLRRSDPQGEELKPAEPAHAIHLNSHIPGEGHTYPAHAPIYPGMYPGSLVHARQDTLQHPLQYLKSQTAVSPLMPPLAFHSMMLQRQLMASGPSPHHYYRHPGGAALYGDLLHHLYPLSTLTPPPLSSVHPSTRL